MKAREFIKEITNGLIDVQSQIEFSVTSYTCMHNDTDISSNGYRQPCIETYDLVDYGLCIIGYLKDSNEILIDVTPEIRFLGGNGFEIVSKIDTESCSINKNNEDGTIWVSIPLKDLCVMPCDGYKVDLCFENEKLIMISFAKSTYNEYSRSITLDNLILYGKLTGDFMFY